MEDDLLMLMFECLFDEVFASEGKWMLNIEIHEYLEVIMAKSFLYTIHYLK